MKAHAGGGKRGGIRDKRAGKKKEERERGDESRGEKSRSRARGALAGKKRWTEGAEREEERRKWGDRGQKNFLLPSRIELLTFGFLFGGEYETNALPTEPQKQIHAEKTCLFDHNIPELPFQQNLIKKAFATGGARKQYTTSQKSPCVWI